MATTKVTSRLQTPADSTGTRKDVHLINTTDEVIVDYSNASASRALTTKLREMRPVVSKDQPSNASFKSSFLWARIVTSLPTYDMEAKVAETTASGVNKDVTKE